MAKGSTKPASFAIAITTSDTVDINFDSTAKATRAIYVGAGGDISVEMAGRDDAGGDLSDPTVVFIGALAGAILPISITRVNSTLTTAASLVALW